MSKVLLLVAAIVIALVFFDIRPTKTVGEPTAGQLILREHLDNLQYKNLK